MKTCFSEENFQKSGKNIKILSFYKDKWHMMYGSSDMECTGQNVLSFWTIFCPFDSLATEKIKILKKWKKCLETSLFYISVQTIMIRWCTVPEIWCITDVIVISHFGLFLGNYIWLYRVIFELCWVWWNVRVVWLC